MPRSLPIHSLHKIRYGIAKAIIFVLHLHLLHFLNDGLGIGQALSEFRADRFAHLQIQAGNGALRIFLVGLLP